MSAPILLVDLGSIYWANWMSQRSQVYAFSETLDRIEWLSNGYTETIICADSPRNWRHELTEHLEADKRYKSNRPPKPKEAIIALEDVKRRLGELGYPVAYVENYEADDLIATLAYQAFLDPVRILSEDKDLYQLLGPTTHQLTRSGVITPAGCERKFGVPPRQVRDLLAIWGDASDCVAGCYGVGQGKAADLLRAFGSIEGIKMAEHEELNAIRGIGPKIINSIYEWDPTLAVQLVSLKQDAPVSLDELRRKEVAA